MIGIRLGAHIKALRTKRQWSQEYLGEVANVDVSLVKLIETSGYCSYRTLAAVANAFGVESDELATTPAVSRRGYPNGTLRLVATGEEMMDLACLCSHVVTSHDDCAEQHADLTNKIFERVEDNLSMWAGNPPGK